MSDQRTGSPRHCCKHCGWELLYHWQYWPRIPEHMGDCPGYEPLPFPSLKECGCWACEEAAERGAK